MQSQGANTTYYGYIDLKNKIFYKVQSKEKLLQIMKEVQEQEIKSKMTAQEHNNIDQHHSQPANEIQPDNLLKDSSSQIMMQPQQDYFMDLQMDSIINDKMFFRDLKFQELHDWFNQDSEI